MQLYYHKTSGGAEYLMDTFIDCGNGHKEGVMNENTKIVVRIDGDITKDAEISMKDDDKMSEELRTAMILLSDSQNILEECFDGYHQSDLIAKLNDFWKKADKKFGDKTMSKIHK